MKVFLGGTSCSNWRNKIIPLLKIDYFHPIVNDWTNEAYRKELEAKEECDYLLFVITPEMQGCYSIAEAVDFSNKNPDRLMFCVLDNYNDKKFDEFNVRSLRATINLIKGNGGRIFNTLKAAAVFLNDKAGMHIQEDSDAE
jgi:hypothetical protein